MGLTDEEFAELYMLGVPPSLLARKTGATRDAVVYRAGRLHIAGASRLAAQRAGRVERIRVNMMASPSVSMFTWGQADVNAA